jgi:predicted dinucleotide-binding enzyme
LESRNIMSTVTIIGTGNMARGIAARAIAAGRNVELLNRDANKSAAVAAELGNNTASGTVGQAPAGDIVVLAVPFDAAKEIVTAYGEALAGKTIVDITNPVNFETFDSLVVAPGTSAAEEIAALTPGNVVKAFNTTFAATLASGEIGGQPTTVLIAGDDTDAKSQLAAVVNAGGLRAIDAGSLRRARELEAMAFLQIALAAGEKISWTGGFAVQA